MSLRRTKCQGKGREGEIAGSASGDEVKSTLPWNENAVEDEDADTTAETEGKGNWFATAAAPAFNA